MPYVRGLISISVVSVTRMTGDCHRETESLSSLDRERMHSLSFFESITSYLYINYDYFPSVDIIKIL